MKITIRGSVIDLIAKFKHFNGYNFLGITFGTLITVVIGLEGTFLGDAKVLGLDGAELGQFNTELGEMGTGDLLV